MTAALPPERRQRPGPLRRLLRRLPGSHTRLPPVPLIRSELFSVERLEQHAQSLARAQQVVSGPINGRVLWRRLLDNERFLRRTHDTMAAALGEQRSITPAAEWLIDNYHVVEPQIGELRAALSGSCYRQLPKLADGPLAGLPRIYGIAWAFVAHSDSRVEPEALVRFVVSYQGVQPLTIGELWAIATTLRLLLVENLRRAAESIMRRSADRAAADAMVADEVVSTDLADSPLLAHGDEPLPAAFAAQLVLRLRDHDPTVTPALAWLDRKLAEQGSTADQIVADDHLAQGADDLTVRNVITSLRRMGAIDWAELFEGVSLVDAALAAASGFAAMDFASRDRYRRAVEDLARGSRHSELAVVAQALAFGAEPGPADEDATASCRRRDPGHALLGAGRRAFERRLAYRAPPTNWLPRWRVAAGMPGYLVTVAVLASALLGALGVTLSATGTVPLAAFALAALAVPLAIDLAMAIVHRGITTQLGPVTLPGLELRHGVPAELRTLIAVPTMLTSEAAIAAHVERLEVHFLASPRDDLVFALLSDWTDADTEHRGGDADLLAAARSGIARLNQRHGPAAGGARFLLLHRRRVWNAGEALWIGWERKRGKLHELNRWLRGACDTTFLPDGAGAPPPDVRYVITLDADTRLPRGAARQLVGKMAHPLQRPSLDATTGRVSAGHAVLQPRITPSLPDAHHASWYQRLYCGPSGTDPYSSAASDVYQDLLGEGSYAGKGIYDIDAFESALAGRVPDNTVLSHDLLEGVFARAALVTDVEIIEDFPARYDVAATRQHRWARGDWQLLPWILGRGRDRSGEPGRAAIPVAGRWKMLDNLRRTLVAPTAVLLLAGSWWLGAQPAMLATLFVIACLAIPLALPLSSLLGRRIDGGRRLPLHGALTDCTLVAARTAMGLTLLAHQATLMTHAIVTTLGRLFVRRRRMLEWLTAAQAGLARTLDTRGFYQRMGGSLLLVALAGGLLVAGGGAAWPWATPVLGLWCAAPFVAHWLSRERSSDPCSELTTDDVQTLRGRARRTWRFFTTFVGADDHWLPPDNYQESPKPVVAHRTSPTNIGLYLLSVCSARDFGWLSTADAVSRLEATLESVDRLAHHRGHLLNWYDTRTLQPLEPKYVSTVDSGNLAGHLIAVGEACREWLLHPAIAAAWRVGVADAVELARSALRGLPTTTLPEGSHAEQLTITLDAMAAALRRSSKAPADVLGDLMHVRSLADEACDLATVLTAEHSRDETAAALVWTQAARDSIDSHCRSAAELLPSIAAGGPSPLRMPTLARLPDLFEAASQRLAGDDFRHATLRDAATAAQSLIARLQALQQRTAARVQAMQFGFLLEPQRRLLAIGYRVGDCSLDGSQYDLLASEARLASFVAISKGDVPTSHWGRLGRGATRVRGGAVLVSWSGSLFEYLMPMLVMREPFGSLLAHTGRLVVRRQIEHGASLGVPWGVSESGYNARDLEFTYQYSGFGVPGLGLKRNLDAETVIAPYATALACMVAPHAALANFRDLAEAGAEGEYGSYEALDYTPGRRPPGHAVAIVQSHMAHHQGMTLVAFANVLLGGLVRTRFHRDPAVQATELLLQERIPRGLPAVSIAARQPAPSPRAHPTAPPPLRHFRSPHDATPRTHLLANGRYAVMLTAAGGGYSRWHDVAVTRWREDVTCDAFGSWFYVRDPDHGTVWSAGYQPTAVEPDSYAVAFAEGRAEIQRRDGDIGTLLEVAISPEHDAEVRRVSLTNFGDFARDLELTSYCEVALTSQAADAAHPAFARMFVQTAHIGGIDALTATRRRRAPDEPELWAAHLAVVEGQLTRPRQYETDRARFLGRGRSTRSPAALQDGRDLSNTVGTVLDPIFSWRVRVRLAPGQTVRVAFWTLVADSRQQVLDLADKHREANAFERATTMAWTQAQVHLHHLGVGAEESLLFQWLANRVLYSEPSLRPHDAALQRGGFGPAALWSQGISGDLPIVLARVHDQDDLALVRQLLRAHQYWRSKQLAVDLVILNEDTNSYTQQLQAALDVMVRTLQSRLPTEPGISGRIFLLRRDLVAPTVIGTLQTAARAVLFGHQGSLAEQIRRQPESASGTTPWPWPATDAARLPRRDRLPAAPPDTEYWNGLGGFTLAGREYMTLLGPGETTPAPWINVIANPAFGFQVSTEGSGYTWSGNSRENQLTPWSNDPTGDPPGEALFLRDLDTGEVWSPTAMPLRAASATFTASHGQGYSRFAHRSHDLSVELLQFVPLTDPVKVSRLRLHNHSRHVRNVSVTAYVEWVLGSRRDVSAHHVVTEVDDPSRVLLARNPWREAFRERVAFLDLGGRQTGWTADRGEFLGRNGCVAQPQALASGAPLSRRCGAGLDPCGVQQTVITIAPGATVDCVVTLGEGTDRANALTLAKRYRTVDLERLLQTVIDHWDDLLGTVQVETPDRSLDLLLNRWLLYQTVACRLWARSAFYQAGGAYGFRDQLQDTMALVVTRPDLTRDHLLRAAARQYEEGDVQHWWLPDSGQGVRTRISDDGLWLSYSAAHYVTATGDAAILDAVVPFLAGRGLRPDETEAFLPAVAGEASGSLFEHCARAIDRALAVGAHGLPLMGTGDWNDGFNRVGILGRGESVWLAWFLHVNLQAMAPWAEARGETARASAWRQHAVDLVAAIDGRAWDGAWYRRGFYDDGTPLGSATSTACRIDAIAQSWAVLCGAGDSARARQAMASLHEHLVDPADGLVRLFTPAFDRDDVDPGYVRGYPPGLRENGGQYTHAALWAVMANTGLGDGDAAARLFSFLNPIRRTRSRTDVQRYKVEPYVVSADVYTEPPHVGRGGWTWYTGSAGWMYRAGLESMLGFRVAGAALTIDPCVPTAWRHFVITYRRGATTYRIVVANPERRSRGVVRIELDGIPLATSPPLIPLVADGVLHVVRVWLG